MSTPSRDVVLLVEHDRALAQSIRRALRSRFEVIVVDSAHAAMAAVSTQSFVCALVEESLPGGSGLELAARIKLERPGMLVTLLAAEFDNETMVTASALGIQVADKHDLPEIDHVLLAMATRPAGL